MKVVSKGAVDSENWKASVICHKRDKPDREGCGAVLEVTKADLEMLFWRGSHFPHYYAAVKCPMCGKHNVPKNIPKPVWEKFNTDKNRIKAVFDGFSDASGYYDGP